MISQELWDRLSKYYDIEKLPGIVTSWERIDLDIEQWVTQLEKNKTYNEGPNQYWDGYNKPNPLPIN